MLSQRPPSLLKRFWLHSLRRPATAPIVTAPPTTTLRMASTASSESTGRTPVRIPGPLETAMQQKLIEAFKPTLIRISNDSSKHSHHAPMRAIGGGSGETHFAVAIVSEEFAGKTQIARHRLVNGLLKDEFDAGLHALSLRLKTPQEWEKGERA